MRVVTRIRLLLLVVGAGLFFSGLGAVRNPKLKMANMAPNTEPNNYASTVPVQLVTSTSSRGFGILGIVSGLGLGALAIWPIGKMPRSLS